MSEREALIALRDDVVAGEIRPYEIEQSAYEVWERDGIKFRRWEVASLTAKAYEGSMDAAIEMLEAVLPGAPFWVETSFWVETKTDGIHHAGVFVPNLERTFQAEAPNLGRALLIATLNALIAETDQ